MKLHIATAILSASSAAAFMAPSSYQGRSSHKNVVVSPEETKAETSASTNNRPIFDPLGLYPESSEEYQQGRIRQLEPTLKVQKPVVDPMGLYPKDSSEYRESFTLEQRYNGITDNDDRPLYDPIGLYPQDSEERQTGQIQAMEPMIEIINQQQQQQQIKDPLGLYPKDSAAYEASAAFDRESLVSKNRQLFDPLGLYPASSVERQEGRIRAVAPTLNVIKPVLDPMNLYEPEQRATEVDQGVIMSEGLPFLPRPAVLDGELAGDFGFDPLGLATSKDRLAFMRQAELKHSRIAMLAAAGWPLSELFDKKFAALLHMKPLLVEGDRVPSLLNGGLSHVNPFYWMGILAVAGFAEALEMMSAKDGWAVGVNDKGRPGFDPLGLFPKDSAGQERMELAEIKNGRLAMLAITAFALMEAVTKTAVVDSSPFFFHPPF